MDKLKTFLASLGLSDDQITQVTSTDAAILEKVDLKTLNASVYSKHKELLKNDDAFLEPLKVEIRGAVLQPRERKARKLFPELTDEEYDALPAETKLDSLIEAGVKKIRESKGLKADEKDKEIERLRAEGAADKAALKKIQEEEIPKIRGEVQSTKNSLKMEREAIKLLAKKKLKIDPEDAYALVIAEATREADISIDDAGFKIKQKGKDLDLFDDKNNKVTFETLIERAVKAKNLEIESNPTPPRKVEEPENTGNKTALPGLKKAQQHAEDMKKAAE